MDFDSFYILSNPLGTNLVPAGTAFTFAVTPASGPAVNYTVPSNVFTTESISITSPTSGVLSNYTLGQPVEVTWTLPTTFAIADVEFESQNYTGPQGQPSTWVCFASGTNNSPVTGAYPTSGTVTILTTCNGQPVLQVDLAVTVTGVKGESAMATVFIQ